MNGDKLVSIYIHVPFCTRKCPYCHFYVLPYKEDLLAKYLHSLASEWLLVKDSLEGCKLQTIYFGGGTPSLLPAEAIEKIILSIFSSLNPASNPIEITLEANPEQITFKKMEAFFKAGINRVSIGVQTFDNTMLRLLGRTHSAEQAVEAVNSTAAAGIKNISIDLMYDLPNHTLTSWEKTVETGVSLPITHLSLYNLTIEPHTSFYKRKAEIEKCMPKEELSALLYSKAIEILQANLFSHYEISAFAKPAACFSDHNIGYWTARPFIGLGPSAYSYWNKSRTRNVADLNRYSSLLQKQTSPIDFEEKLSEDRQRKELLAIALRQLKGIDLAAFQAANGELELETVQSIEQLVKLGFLEKKEKVLALTRRGLFCYDAVAVELI